jgi:uncharacterized protein YjiS (DUF1127 family)
MNALTHDIRTAATQAKAAKAGAGGARPERRASAILQVLRALVRSWRTRREIARLSALPDSTLKDIGVSRGGIPRAVTFGRRYEGE